MKCERCGKEPFLCIVECQECRLWVCEDCFQWNYSENLCIDCTTKRMLANLEEDARMGVPFDTKDTKWTATWRRKT